MKNNYQILLKEEVLKFKDARKNLKLKFLKKLSSTNKITKELNIDEHFCAFFVPINKETKSIYLVHHIKADDWIPPGGHLKFGEHPSNTVIREFEEELNHKIEKKQISVFELSIKDVSDNPRSPCKIHYDFWYLIDVPKINFKFLRKEFYDAYWHPLNEQTINKIKTSHYKKIVEKLGKII